MRQHKRVLDLPWKPSVKRAERSNAIDVIASGVLGKEISENSWKQNFLEPVRPLTSVSFFFAHFQTEACSSCCFTSSKKVSPKSPCLSSCLGRKERVVVKAC